MLGEFNARVGCGVGGDPWDDVCGQQCGVRLAAWATNQTLSDKTPPVQGLGGLPKRCLKGIFGMLQCRCSCGRESSAQQSIEDLIVALWWLGQVARGFPTSCCLAGCLNIGSW